MKMDRGEFIALIKQNVAGEVNVDDIKPDDRLADIGIDSLGFATLLWAIEAKFDIKIDDSYLESLNGLSTVSDLVATFKALGHEIEIEDTVS